MLKRLAVLALAMTLLVGCGGRSRHHPPPPVDLAAELIIENEDGDAIDIFLDFEFIGTVPAFSSASFLVSPGEYELEVDVVGDADGPIAYTTVRLQPGVALFVNVTSSLFNLLLDIIFE